jgi:hypothetical protein
MIAKFAKVPAPKFDVFLREVPEPFVSANELGEIKKQLLLPDIVTLQAEAKET